MPILANLCDKACFAHKFSWLAKRDATISPVKAKVNLSSCVLGVGSFQLTAVTGVCEQKKAPKVPSLSQDKQLYKLLVRLPVCLRNLIRHGTTLDENCLPSNLCCATTSVKANRKSVCRNRCVAQWSWALDHCGLTPATRLL